MENEKNTSFSQFEALCLTYGMGYFAVCLHTEIAQAALFKHLGLNSMQTKFNAVTRCHNFSQSPGNLHFSYKNFIPTPDLNVVKIISLLNLQLCQPAPTHLSLQCSYLCLQTVKLKVKAQVTQSDRPSCTLTCVSWTSPLNPGCMLE